MWQTARPAPATTPVVVTATGEEATEHRLQLGRALQPCSDQQRAKSPKGNEWLRRHGTSRAKTGFSAQPTQPRAKVRAVVAGVLDWWCVWLWLKRHGGPAAPDSGCRLAGLAGWLHAPKLYLRA